jgi:hypothetical protein
MDRAPAALCSCSAFGELLKSQGIADEPSNGETAVSGGPMLPS